MKNHSTNFTQIIFCFAYYESSKIVFVIIIVLFKSNHFLNDSTESQFILRLHYVLAELTDNALCRDVCLGIAKLHDSK